MKTQTHNLILFVMKLPKTWVQQFFLLGERIKRLPKNKETMEVIIGICFGLMIAIPGAFWAVNAVRCPNKCGGHVGFNNSDSHKAQCKRCGTSFWGCPRLNLSHPHLVECTICGKMYYDCPPDEDGTPKSEAPLHGDGICSVPPRQLKGLETQTDR